MDESTTKKLAEILSNIDDEKQMEEYLNQPKVSDSYKSFTEYFKSLTSVKSLTDTDIIKASGIEKSYYYQIMKETRKPGRDKILRLCIGAGLNMNETTRMLELSENASLYPRNKRDVIISVAIKQHITVIETNLLLDKYEEQPLA